MIVVVIPKTAANTQAAAEHAVEAGN
jgi:hypothetical protein